LVTLLGMPDAAAGIRPVIGHRVEMYMVDELAVFKAGGRQPELDAYARDRGLTPRGAHGVRVTSTRAGKLFRVRAASAARNVEQ
jgi:hypothetical protein